jgi:Flp pilus assembly pilin Flp
MHNALFSPPRTGKERGLCPPSTLCSLVLSLLTAFGHLPSVFQGTCLTRAPQEKGQTTVEYVLAIGVIAVAMAAVLSSGILFEALADLFDQLARKIALPMP